MAESRSWTARIATLGASALALGAAPLLLSGCSWGPKVRVSEDDSFVGNADCEVLVVWNDVGDVRVLSDPGAYEIRADVVKTGKGRTLDQAEEALDEIEIEFRADPSDGSIFNAIVHHPKHRRGKAYEVDWSITAPAHLRVRVTNDVGDVDIDGFESGVWVKNDVGDVNLYGARGGAHVHNDVGDVRADAAGEVWLRTDVGDIVLDVLEVSDGDILARTDVGDAVVYLPRGWEGEISAESDVGGVSVRPEGEPMRIYRDKKGRFEGVMGSRARAKLEIRTDVGSARVRMEGSDRRERGSDEVVSREAGNTPRAY